MGIVVFFIATVLLYHYLSDMSIIEQLLTLIVVTVIITIPLLVLLFLVVYIVGYNVIKGVCYDKA